MREPITWNPFPAKTLPLGRPVLCRNRNEIVPYMAVMDTDGPTMEVLGKNGARTGSLAHLSGLSEWADVCPGVHERREWVKPAH